MKNFIKTLFVTLLALVVVSCSQDQVVDSAKQNQDIENDGYKVLTTEELLELTKNLPEISPRSTIVDGDFDCTTGKFQAVYYQCNDPNFSGGFGGNYAADIDFSLYIQYDGTSGYSSEFVQRIENQSAVNCISAGTVVNSSKYYSGSYLWENFTFDSIYCNLPGGGQPGYCSVGQMVGCTSNSCCGTSGYATLDLVIIVDITYADSSIEQYIVDLDLN